MSQWNVEMFDVSFMKDSETNTYMAFNEELGLAAEADTMEELEQLCLDLAPILYEENNHTKSPNASQRIRDLPVFYHVKPSSWGDRA